VSAAPTPAGARARAALFCPGRGSYTEKSLRSLDAADAAARDEALARADARRRELGLGPLRELDAAAKFDPAVHLDPLNASALIYVNTWLDARRAREEHELVVVGGNSMGWYSALAVAGSLSFDDGFRLVQTMALLQKEQQARAGGGQVIHPVVDDDWRASAERAGAVERALATSNGEAFRSIDLGGYVVLAGSEAGLRHVLAALPKVKLGANQYPFRLVQHGAYHTPLLQGVADAARARLGGAAGSLSFRQPHTPLVDGAGRVHSPWSADPDALRDYTFGAQVTTRYDFTTSVRVALREHAPERIVLPGPGNTLGAVCAQVAIGEGWRGLSSKAAFEALQASADPLLVSMRR
jgi:malonyl CoA-acyl carrier protein transacylase